VLVVVLAPGPEVAVAGFGLAGLGVSVLFPLIYGAAGSLAAVSSGSGLALMSVGARAGFLAGPVLVGVTADLAGLRVAVGALVLAALAGVVATRSRLARHAA
jgi:MFS family permease